jgi:hypothetical protein
MKLRPFAAVKVYEFGVSVHFWVLASVHSSSQGSCSSKGKTNLSQTQRHLIQVA